MVIYGTRFAFLSNYQWTIFLRIDDSKVKRRRGNEYDVVPCLYFSDPIHKSQFTGQLRDRSGRLQQSISVRSALFYLIHRTGFPDSTWRIHPSLKATYLKQNIKDDMSLEAHMVPRYSQSAVNPT
jgi:hypothetical protein